MNKIPFAIPDISELEIQEVVDSMRSGWLTTGPKVEKFENAFVNYLNRHGNKQEIYATSLNSATAGLHLSLESLGIGEGDEVITTPFTFTATAEVIEYVGAKVVFADIDPTTLNISPIEIEKKITNRTKAIIPVHYAGLPCDMNQIQEICDSKQDCKIRIIEDAAHALPSFYNSLIVGTLDSDATVFSFYATKTITTGEGGMVVSKNRELIDRIKVLKLHGIDRNVYNRYVADKPSWYYEVVYPGYKYNMTDIAASIGIHQLNRCDSFHHKRTSIAEYYNDRFSDLKIKLPPRAPEKCRHSWHLYPIRIQTPKYDRDTFISKMSSRGIGCSVHFIPLHIQPYWKKRYNLVASDFPNSFEAYRQIVSLPIHTKMSHDQVERVVNSTIELLK